MTEDEAKTKICCGPLHQPEFQKIGEVSISTPMLRNCLGSQCMAWRWTPQTDPLGRPTYVRETEGYCGLAGSP